MADFNTNFIAVTAEPRARSGATPSATDIGSVIARVFDLLKGSGLEPFAAQVASNIVNGPRRPCRA